MYSLFLLGISSFLIAFFLTPFVRNLSRRWGMVDHPDGRRKVHTAPIPRVGGIAILLAYCGAFGVLLVSQLKGGWLVISAMPQAVRLLPAVLLVFLVGLADDLWGLKPWPKLAGEAAAAGLALWAGVEFGNVMGYELSDWLSYPLTIVWLVGCMNAVNLIDGVDGLAAGVGLFATVTALIAALMGNHVGLALATIPLAGALLGFLRYNFNPASIFLGDSGSLTVGFLLGCFAALWAVKSATVLGMTAPLMALALPLLDTGLAVARRFLRRQPIFEADKGHIHHRLMARGLTARRAALVLYGACGLAAALSLIGSVWQDSTGVVLVLFCAATWIGVQNLGYTEFGTAGRMIRDGAFRGMLNRELALGSFREELTLAKSGAERWEALTGAYEAFGFTAVQARLAGEEYQRGMESVNGTSWEIRVKLPEGDFVRLVREPGTENGTMGAAAFAEAISLAMRGDPAE